MKSEAEPQVETLYKQDDVQVLHTKLESGQEIPWHVHSQVRDLFYALRGSVEITTRVPDARVSLQPGETFHTRAGQPHRVVNQTDQSAEFLLIQGIGDYDFRPL